MKKNKTILIVGAGYGQLPAILKAKEMGLTVITTDKNPEAQGMKLADYSYAIDILDQQGTLEIAKKHNIDGVITMQSDLPVPTIGFINDNLQLNGVSAEVAQLCSNKIETRKILRTNNCSQPNFELISTIQEATMACEKIGYPCVIKAPDSSGSRGITKVNHEDEIKDAYEEALKFSRQELIIVEEFIEGLEFGAQTFSVNGKCEIVLLHSDILSPKPYMIPIGHSFPFTEISDLEKSTAINDIKKAINVLGIKDGPANIDFILDKNTQRIKIIEVGARIGATCLPELVHYHTGIDWVKQTILSALNEKTDLQILKEIHVTAFIISAPKDGKLLEYSFPKKMLSHRDLLEYEITAEIGDDVNILRKGTDRIGKVIFKGDSVNESIDNCLKFIKETVLEIT